VLFYYCATLKEKKKPPNISLAGRKWRNSSTRENNGCGGGAIDVLRIVPLESETKGQFSDGVGSLLD
jgi:hypothetical protein